MEEVNYLMNHPSFQDHRNQSWSHKTPPLKKNESSPRPEATAPIRPLAWDPPYAAGAALKKTDRQTERKEGRKEENIQVEGK